MPSTITSITNKAKSLAPTDPHKLSNKVPTDIPNEIVESQTKKIPNLVFLGFAGAAMVASAMMAFRGKNRTLANFVGLWVPTVMILGVYNKIVKVEDEMLEATREVKNLH